MLCNENIGSLIAVGGLLIQLLEHHEVVPIEGRCVELAEVDVHGTALAVRSELEFSGDMLVVDRQHLAGLLIHERRLEGVFLARNQTLVCHAVGDDRILSRHERVVAVGLVRGGGGDDARNEVHRLLIAVKVALGSDDDGGSALRTVLEHDLEHHDVLGLAAEAVDDIVGVEVEVHRNGAVILVGSELRLLEDQMGDEVTVVGDELVERIRVDVCGKVVGTRVVEDDASLGQDGDIRDGGFLLIGELVVTDAAGRIHVRVTETVPIHAVLRSHDLIGAVNMDAHALGFGNPVSRILGNGNVKIVLAALVSAGDAEHIEELLHELGDIVLGVLLAAVSREDGQAGVGIHEDACHGVINAGQGVLVGDIIGDGGLRIGDDGLIAVKLVGSGCRDASDAGGRGLLLVLDVLVLCDGYTAAFKGLEHHEVGLVLDGTGIEGEGHIDLAVSGIGREGGLSGDGLAVHLKRLGSDLAVLVGLLDLHGTLHGVLLAGDEAGVFHGVDDGGLRIGHDVLVAVVAVESGGGDARVADGDRLPLILDVGVGREFMAVVLKGLERDEVRLVLEGEGVEREGHVHGALGALGREGGFSRHGLTVHFQNFLGDLALIIGLLDVQGALDGVLLAGDEVLVGHTVGDGRLVVSRHVLVAVRAIHGGGADFRLDDGHLLVHVGLIGVLSDEGATIIVQLLIDRDGLAAEGDGVDGELHDLKAGWVLSRESLLHGDGVAGGVQQDVAGRGVVKLRRQLVVAVREEVGVGHLVGDLDLPHADEGIAVHRVVGLGGDGRLHVGEGAEVVHLAVAAHDNRGLDELIALVGGAAKLLDGVGAVGQCALGVICLGIAEPDTGGGIQLGAVDNTIRLERPVVAVGVVGVLVPRGDGGEVAVLIRHDHMALARGLGGELESDTSESVLTVLALLGELKVAAHDLVLDGAVMVDGVHQHAVIDDAELVDRIIQQVAFGSLDLLHGVSAVGEHVRVGHGLTVLDDEDVDDLILGVGLAVHDDGIVVEGFQLELGSVEGKAVLRVAAGLGVGLDESHAAALHIVLGREGVDLAVLAHLHAHLGGGVEVGAVGLSLADDVIAVGEGVGTGGGEALGIGRDDLHGLALGVGLAVHLHDVLVVVDDGEADAFKGSGTLWSLAGLGVELLDGHAAANHRLGDFREIKGRDTLKRILLNLLEAHIGVELVSDVLISTL